MNTHAEQEIVSISKKKWEWMSAQDVAPLAQLFHQEAVFVHMGATFSKDEELDVIRTGHIHYRDVDVSDVSVRFVGSTAIVLTTLQLGSVVAGNEVSNPFVVTEVYVLEGDGVDAGIHVLHPPPYPVTSTTCTDRPTGQAGS